MRLMGKPIKTMKVKDLQDLCRDWKEFASNTKKYEGTIVPSLIVEWMKDR